MAVKDCIKKLKKAGIEVEPTDVIALEKYIAAGLTDEQAVARLNVDVAVDIIDIADYVVAEGGEVATGRGQLAEVRDFRTEKLRSLMGKRSEIIEKIEKINDDYKLLVQDAGLFDEFVSREMGERVVFSELTESEMKMILGQLLIKGDNVIQMPGVAEPVTFARLMREAVTEVTGETPAEIYESRSDLEDRMAQNRKEKQLLEQQHLEAQESIDRGFKSQTTRELFQGPIDEETGALDTVLAEAGVDQANMFDLFGPSMYGDMAKMGAVSIKELFQNSYDAVQAGIERGEIEKGKIDVTVSGDGRSVTVTDNGRGMDLDIILNAFLKQAGTRKEAKRPAGGFGLAKMLFLLGNKRLQLETIRDGVKYTMDVTGTEVMDSAKDPEAAKLHINRERTDEPSGTKVTIEIPEEFANIAEGGALEAVEAITFDDVNSTVSGQLLTPDIEVTRQGRTYTMESSGANFNTDNFFSLGRVKFEWGTADVLIAKDRRYQFDTNTTVMVEGLKQFDMQTTENPLEIGSGLIDRKFLINLHPNVEPKDPRYPFAHNRQGLKPHAQSDITKIQLIMVGRHNVDKVLQTSKGYGTLRTISVDADPQVEQTDLFGKHLVSEPIDIEPDIPEDVRRTGLTANEGDQVEVREDKLYINGVEQAEMTAEDFGGVRFDVKEAKINQSRIPNDQPLLHNYQKFKATDQIDAIDDGAWAEFADKDLIEVLYEKFGAERVNAYFAGVGNAFLRIRNLVAVKGNQDRYAGMDKAGVGVSVLGTGYYGVHTKVPGTMMFINPGADPKGPHIDETLPEPEKHKIIATSMLTTMVHEIAHFDQMNHGTEFIFALQDAFATTFGETEFIDGVRRDLQGALSEASDIYGFIHGALQGQALEITGQDLTELGQATTRDERGPGDVAGERDTGETGQRAGRTADRRGDRDIGTELDDRAVQKGRRESGVVVPRGTVHPQAGEDRALPQYVDEERQARLEEFMYDSHVVDENGDPMVVYHGTQFSDERIEVLQPKGSLGGWNNMGTWFSNKREHAERFSAPFDPDDTPVPILEAYVSIRRPWETTWDELQVEIDAALEQHNARTGDEVVKWSGLRGETSKAGLVLREHFQKKGYDGIIIRDFEGDGAPAQDMFVAFESAQVKSTKAQVFDPSTANIYRQGERGRIQFNEARKGFIEILSSGDASTFIHETAHLYLEVMRWAAQQPNATDRILRDWETIKRDTGATDEEISKDAHENFANKFEIYALEGKAPSLALQDSFNAYRGWMLWIYSTIKKITGVHLNDDIRGVFDRMLASDAEIAIAEQSQGYVALFADAELADMTQEEFDYYAAGVQRAHDDGVEKESVRMIKEMKRDLSAQRKEERAKIREEVEAEVHEMRVYRALAMLQRGKRPDGSAPRGQAFKIDKKSLMDLLAGDQESINQLPRPYIYTLEGGVSVEIAANNLDYADPLDMIREISEAQPMKARIETETEIRMQQAHPNPMTDGTLGEHAIRRVHSEKRLNILATELRQLRKLRREDAPAVRAARQGERREDRQAREANRAQLPKRAEMAMLKAGARDKVNSMQIRDIKPHVYLRAEQKAGRAAFEAMEKRDYQAAYEQKLRQIVNHEMYRAALAVQKEMDSTRNFLVRFEGPRKQRQLARAGVLNQVKAVLEGIEFRKKSLAQVDRDNAMKQLKQAVLDGRLVVTPATMAKIADESVNWQEFTPDELRGLKDVLKQIEHGAVMEDKMTVNGELVEYQQAEDEVVESIRENNEVIELRPGGVKTAGERANKNVDQGIMTWLRPSSIARVLDKAGFGAVTRHIIVPMRRAYAEKLIPMLHQAQRDVAGIYNKHYNAKELGQMSKRQYKVESLNATYSKSELLSMALNWGNEGNRTAVLGGTYEGSVVFSEQSVRQMLAHLTVKDWAFVQDIWDYNDTYREAIFDAEERRRGIRPEMVEASPFEIRTADGETIIVRGGYHPLRYDRDFDPKSGKRESPDKVAEDIQKQLQHVAVGATVTANTRAGSTYNRVQNHGRVVRLGLNIIDSHLREVIRDIAIGDEVFYIKRMLESGGVKRALIDTNNQEALEALDLWLTDAAVGELPAENAIEFAAAWIRTGFTKAKLGWNFTVMFLQFTGLFQTIAVIGTVPFSKGLAKFMQNPAAAMRTVQEVSQFIKTRYVVGAFDKDVADTKAIVESEFGSMPTRSKRAMNLIGSTLFAGIAQAQKYVDVITWLGAYEKGLGEINGGLSEADAIIYADTQVEAAQTSGFFSDRSGLERGTTGLRKNRQSQFIRIWTTLISYMLAKSNIAYEKYKDTNLKDPKETMALIYDLLMLYTVEGIASALLYNRLPEDDDDPEDWALWALAQSGESLVSGIPFVREIAAARFGGGNTPIGVFSNDALRLIDQIAQGDMDWASVDATLDVVGTAAHLPTGQLSKTGKKLWEEGLTTDEWWEYFSGPRD